MKLLGINLECIQKRTPEDNGDIESFHNSNKIDYIWPNEFRGKFLNDPAFMKRFEKKEIEVKLDEN